MAHALLPAVRDSMHVTAPGPAEPCGLSSGTSLERPQRHQSDTLTAGHMGHELATCALLSY